MNLHSATQHESPALSKKTKRKRDRKLESIRAIAQRRGRRPCAATCIRWVRVGLRRVKLKGVKLQGMWLTTEKWFDQWVEDVGQAQVPAGSRHKALSLEGSFPRVEDAIAEAHKQAKNVLRQHGLGGDA